MNAIDITGSFPGGEKIPLSQLVPLRTPLVIQVFPIYDCNFACEYCSFSIEEEKRGFISDRKKMDLELYKKCVNDLIFFKDKIKVIRFVGMGEPLLHKDLSEMIKYTRQKEVAERIEIITNGSLFTKKISDKIINSAPDKIIISVQGISSDEYLKNSKIKIDFNKFIKNLEYLYSNRHDIKIHIKIADCTLNNNKEDFFKTFGNICDTIAIENIGPIHSGVAFNKRFIGKPLKNQYGADYTEITVCSQPFYLIQINPDGKIVPCYSHTYPEIIGDCNVESIFEIWNGEKMNKFRYKMLNGIDTVCDICQKCNIIRHRACNTDDLSKEISRLKNFYGNTKMSNL